MAKLTPTYNLAVIHPEIAKLWHTTRNGNLTPHSVTPSSGKRIWWLCQKGHEWQDTVSNRAQFRTGCPYCSRRRVCADNCLETLAPHIVKEWHPTKNNGLTPKDVTAGSDTKAWWICENGHEWQAKVHQRKRGSGCPYCARNSVRKRATDQNNLQKKNPRLAVQWHPTKNGVLLPKDVTPRSGQKVWWLCNKGHEWQAMVSNRANGRGCPYCAGFYACVDNCLATLSPHIAGQWHPLKNGELTPTDVTKSSNKKVWWLCANGHEWKATVGNRTNGRGCPGCNVERRRSRRL